MRGDVRKQGERWYVRFEGPRDAASGKRQRKRGGGFATKREAVAALNRLLAAQADGTLVEPSKLTVAGYFASWIDAAVADLRPATADQYRRLFERYVRDRIGTVPLQRLEPETLDKLFAVLRAEGGKGGAPLAGSTVHKVRVLLVKMLRRAVATGKVSRNAAELSAPVRQRGMRRDELQVWDGEQLGSFVRAASSDRLAALWRLFASTGCRRGEALGVKWSDLDLDEGTWSVRRSLAVVNGSPVMMDPKTSTGRRRVDLDAGTVAALRTHRAAQNAERLAWGAHYVDDGFVFTSENGAPLHPNVTTRQFQRLAMKIGLPRIRLHDLRHSYASVALRAGVPVKVLSERLGHASTSFTMDVYASVLPGMGADAAAKVAAILDGSTG